MAGKRALLDCVQEVKVDAVVSVPGVYELAGHGESDLSLLVIFHFSFSIFHLIHAGIQ
jgi:hypothetical protein